MKLTAILLVPIMVATPALCQVKVKLANVGTVTFNCGTIPEVCKNMCFGVHCRGGRYGKTLTYDPAGDQDVRRRAAGCGPNNRCSTTAPWAGTNQSCDEFPFANSREADAGGQNNRCVPAVQNNSQGGTLGAFITAKTNFIKNQPPFQYNIAFTNTAKVQYCFDNGANTCDADPNQWVGRAVAPNGGKWVPRLRRREEDAPAAWNQYMSKRGELVTSARPMEVGEKLYHAELDPVAEKAARENPDEEARNAFYADPANYEIVEDEVVRPVTRDEAATLEAAAVKPVPLV